MRLLVLSDSAAPAELLAASLGELPEITVQTCLAGALDALQSQSPPDVAVVVEAETASERLVIAVETAFPEVPVVVLLRPEDARQALACSAAGARATLFMPVDAAELAATLRQLVAREGRRLNRLTPDSAATPTGASRIIAVHGAKGGVGATTLACNLAAALHHHTGRRVASIDGDVLGGGAGVLFDTTSSRTMADLLAHAGDLDAELVERLLVRHSSGVHVLLAPDSWRDAGSVGPADIHRVLTALKPYFDYQVVDTSSQMTPVTIAVLEAADLIALVVTPEIASLRSASRFFQLLSQLGIDGDRVRLVVNRANAGKDITPRFIEQYFVRPVALALPSDGLALVECLNAGQLVVTARPELPFATQIAQLGDEMATALGWAPPAPIALAPRRSGLQFWRRTALAAA
jgi:pilus assembly protein CpaE